ncbi:MAG: hypothetical protein BWX99_02366 [Deltaproteobacteria bacterium ADurb.Bin151]|nr:MAG: hypothetical protein BWX99_02366 [Deltaproteobacteria bacterium ADurb.Bin151]
MKKGGEFFLGFGKTLFCLFAFSDVGEKSCIAFYTIYDNRSLTDVGVKNRTVFAQAGDIECPILLYPFHGIEFSKYFFQGLFRVNVVYL